MAEHVVKTATQKQLLVATLALLVAIFFFWTLTLVNEYRTQQLAIERIEKVNQPCR